MMQQSFTIVQEEHRKKTHTLAFGDPNLVERDSSKQLRKKRKPGQKNRLTTVRAPNQDQLCPFKFIVFLSSDQYWYLSCLGRYDRKCCTHLYHLRTLHHQLQKQDLSDEVIKYITDCVCNSIGPSTIRLMLRTQFNVSVDNATIRSIREDHIDSLLDDVTPDPSGMGPAKRLIALFRKMPNVSFCYVSHHIRSGLVTYHRKRGESKSQPTSNEGDIVASQISANDVGVSIDQIESWRRELQISTDEILLGLAFVHDDELRYVQSCLLS